MKSFIDKPHANSYVLPGLDVISQFPKISIDKNIQNGFSIQ